MDERAFRAGQNFLLGAKRFWTTTMYGRLREEYEARCKALGKSPKTVAEVAAVVEELPLYRYFAWLERHLQRMKYSGHYGLARYYQERREEVRQRLNGAPQNGLLELHPEMDLPSYYTATDIHQHPGGVWSEEEAGFVYEHGARTTTPLLGDSHGDLHSRFTDAITRDKTVPGKVLDMACGFGKSTAPFARKFPKAQVEAVDLSAPCLKVAAQSAEQSGMKNVHYRQMDAAATDYPNNSFDLVTSTMFLHEVPPKYLDRVLDESYRVLAPGGRAVHLDFWHLPDPFARFIHYGHGRRNNEPYMQPLAEIDLPKLLREKGFTDIEIKPFKEADGPQTDPNGKAWHFPWSLISARKPKSVARAAAHASAPGGRPARAGRSTQKRKKTSRPLASAAQKKRR